MLDRLAMLFILLGLCTSLMILKDIFRYPQPVHIMNVVWPITGLYMPFIGWLAWWFFARKNYRTSAFITRNATIASKLKQIFYTTSHCAAGYVVGDIISVSIISCINYIPFHSLFLTHVLLSLMLSFFCSVLFQFFALRQTEGVTVFRGLWRAMRTDIFSLIVFQAGMVLSMSLALRFILHDQFNPLLMPFWFMVQIALFSGFIFALPANRLLLQRGVKSVP